jgi:hypothetical protein
LALIAGGIYLAYEAWQRKFLDNLRTSRMRTRTRRVVERLGVTGGIARGVVFCTAGIFLVVAAVKAQPGQAKGIDSALRVLAATPLGPVVLAGVSNDHGLLALG